MKNLIILGLTLASALALPTNEIKSRNRVVPAGRPEGRISRGIAAKKGQFPYQVALMLTSIDFHRYICGGSLLNNKWVLTAAHCVFDAIQVEVFLGATDRRSPEVTHLVYQRNIIIHKDFDVHAQENDIALLEIPFTEYSHNIKPVKLPDMVKSNSSYAGESAIATGWGLTSNSASSTPEMLHWVKLTVISNEACQRSFQIPPSNICTATIEGSNVCDGDSGGPIVLESNNVQIGVISFGVESCTKSVPAVYTRVTSYLKWIEEKTGIST